MVRVVATSDLHGHLPDIPECELLLICGDICPDGDPIFQAHWLDTVFRNWLEKIPAGQIVGVAGNHDIIFEKAKHLVPAHLHWHYLQDSGIELSGFKIYGSPWQLPFWGAFNADEERLGRIYNTIPSDVDIIISHGPPFGIWDKVTIYSEWEALREVEHTGSQSLRKKLFEIKPQLFVCGHIHCSSGSCKIGETIFANVSLLDDEMKVVNPPLFFELM